MSDIIDDAQNYNELYQKVAFDNQQLKLKPESHPSFNGIDCVDCDEPMLPERLRMRRVRCTPCQDILEQRARQFAL